MDFYLSHYAKKKLIYHCRFLWLTYLISMQQQNYYRALKELEQMLLLFSNQSELLCITLPNQRHNNFFNKYSVQQLIAELKRKIGLCAVEHLYNEKKYNEVVDLLKLNLVHLSDIPVETDLLNVLCQMEVLLECLWNVENYSECLSWAEQVLKYTSDIFISLSDSYTQKCWSKTINFTLDYILAIIKRNIIDISNFQNLARMVQSIHEMLTYLLDPHQDKYLCDYYTVDCDKAWAILYYILESDDDKILVFRSNRISDETSPLEMEEETLFGSIMIFFVAHELLGRRQWCSNNNSYILEMMLDVIAPMLRSPLLEPYRDFIIECLEQTTYCLYGYPQKKGRTRHIQDHEATQKILTWKRAVQLFDIYRPDELPEFNSYKIDSITADMEAFLKHILLIFPEYLNISKYTEPTYNFINGTGDIMPNINIGSKICIKIRPIYYLLADYYFKNRDFSKAIEFYIMDLTVEPTRFDSWAGVALSKASKCETLLNSAEIIRLDLLKIKKNVSENIAYKCFNLANIDKAKKDVKETNKLEHNGHHEDEIWLYYYMLGKITEKRKEPPVVYLSHYLKSAKILYDCNATYPIKVNHSNPSHLSIEALELFYRTTVAIMKYTDQHEILCKQTIILFKNVLKELTICPFAVNRAKVNDIAFQKKTDNQTTDSSNIQKPNITGNCAKYTVQEVPIATKISNDCFDSFDKSNKNENEADSQFNGSLRYGLRRSSQESNAATCTTVLSTSNMSSSFSSSSNSINSELDSTSETDSDSTTEDESSHVNVRDAIYRDCIKNLEECITRFPEHFKSIYRLAYHYMYAPGCTRSLERCRELMLGSYRTTLGNEITGLFSERRNNNFFNGIWRIPSSDFDRPGSFAVHLSKCVTVLIDTLKLSNDYKTLFDLAFQLGRTPDIDKKYLNESDRGTLFDKAAEACIQVFKMSLQNHYVQNNDNEILSVLIEIFKAYRKTSKHLQELESKFSKILTDGYKMFVFNKAQISENDNVFDLAVKLCTYEINYRKTMDKLHGIKKTVTTGMDAATTMITPMRPISAVYIPGLTKQRKIIIAKKEPPASNTATTSSLNQTFQGQACNVPPVSHQSTLSPTAMYSSSSTNSIHHYCP
ncbi:calcineurin-binding protein cabin-1-like isoform X2 [Wyeomyia smithii]|uniref:calcineurin-binding protein cabin-1-like isoform X2 n=1 Tax=Wyeomyia smithii TaxID=174621 RepID=UPI002467C28F|nr:calcineurin-binding protein cabin-1-like isoform X2 [Wyeomyia smithii]